MSDLNGDAIITTQTQLAALVDHVRAAAASRWIPSLSRKRPLSRCCA